MKIELKIDRERNLVTGYAEDMILFSGKLGGCDFLSSEEQDRRVRAMKEAEGYTMEVKEK